MALMQLICTFGYLIVTEKNKKFHFFKFSYKKDLFFFIDMERVKNETT